LFNKVLFLSSIKDFKIFEIVRVVINPKINSAGKFRANSNHINIINMITIKIDIIEILLTNKFFQL
jgi:hypothetical protein